MKNYIKKNRLVINYIFVLIVILLLTFLIIIGLHYTQIKTEIINNMLTPIITILGFSVVIITLFELKKNNNYRISIEYFGFIESKVDKLINEALEYDLNDFKKTKTYMLEDTTLLNAYMYKSLLNNSLINDKIYNKDINNINKLQKRYKDDIKGFLEFLRNKPYKDIYSDLTSLIITLKGFYSKGALLVKEIINSKQLIENHKDLLLRKIIIEFFKDYIIYIIQAPISNIILIDKAYSADTEYLYDYKYFSFLYEIFDNPILSKIVSEELKWDVSKRGFENFCKKQNYHLPIK